MRNVGIITLILLVNLIVSCNGKAKLDTDVKKQSYSYGYLMGKDFVQKEAAIDAEALSAGLKDAYKDKAQLSDEDMQDAIMALQEALRQQYNEKMMNERTANAQKSDAFLKENKAKKGVTQLKSGLQYKVIKNGNGKMPKAEDSVTVHYKGTLIDGTEFDSSYKRNEPAEFKLNQVIKGWTEGLQLMKEGSKWELYVPADLAYGANGAGGAIGPNEALIFEVELIKVNN
jgi:FKBP-type peptidyl-prolyl cis-trans isomerase